MPLRARARSTRVGYAKLRTPHEVDHWTRTGDVEVDLVGAEWQTRPDRVRFVGSIKWRERAPFDRRDLAHLVSQTPRVPGADEATLTIGVSRAGFDVEDLDAKLNPDDLLGAWG